MGLPVQNEKYTYKDYLTWDDDTKWELIEGIPYNMSPSSGLRHQKILMELAGEFRSYFKDKSCTPCLSPLDVLLPGPEEDDEEIDTVVQPDLFIVRDASKLDEQGCRGAPDLVVEILSPSTAKKDLNNKKQLYEKHGVKEYWIVHPYEDCIEVFKPDKEVKNGPHQVYAGDDTITSGLFPGMEIKLGDIFVKHPGTPGQKKERTGS